MRTGLHHTGVELERREGDAWFESPTESEFDSPTIMVLGILPRQECLTDGYSSSMDGDKGHDSAYVGRTERLLQDPPGRGIE